MLKFATYFFPMFEGYTRNAEITPPREYLTEKEPLQVLEDFLREKFSGDPIDEVVKRIEKTVQGMDEDKRNEVIQYAKNTFQLAAYFGYPSIQFPLARYKDLSFPTLKAISYYLAQLIEQKEQLIKDILELNEIIDSSIKDSFIPHHEYFILSEMANYKEFIQSTLSGSLIPNIQQVLECNIDTCLKQIWYEETKYKGEIPIQYALRKTFLNLIGVRNFVRKEQLENYLNASFVKTHKGKMQIGSSFLNIRSSLVELNKAFFEEVNSIRRELAQGEVYSLDAWIQAINLIENDPSLRSMAFSF